MDKIYPMNDERDLVEVEMPHKNLEDLTEGRVGNDANGSARHI